MNSEGKTAPWDAAVSICLRTSITHLSVQSNGEFEMRKQKAERKMAGETRMIFGRTLGERENAGTEKIYAGLRFYLLGRERGDIQGG